MTSAASGLVVSYEFEQENIYILTLLSIPQSCYNGYDTGSTLIVFLCHEWGDCLGIMTVREAAQKWGVTPRRVGDYIRDERIEGAYKIGAAWVMPDDTKKPANIKSGRKTSQERNTT